MYMLSPKRLASTSISNFQLKILHKYCTHARIRVYVHVHVLLFLSLSLSLFRVKQELLSLVKALAQDVDNDVRETMCGELACFAKCMGYVSI